MAGSIRALCSALSRARMRSSSAPASPPKADDIRNQNRRNLPGLAQGAPSRAMSVAQNPLGQCAKLIEAIQLREGGLEPSAESRLGVELTRPRRRRMTAFCGYRSLMGQGAHPF